MPLGISAAPAILQRFTETLFYRIPGIDIYLNAIIISGTTASEHLKRLDQVLTRLGRSGLWLKKSKCQFGVSQEEYLRCLRSTHNGRKTEGYSRGVDANAKQHDGIAVVSWATGTLRQFFCQTALPRQELYRLLEKDVKWKWQDQHSQAVLQLKREITGATRLAYFDERKQLAVSRDASPYRHAAVFEQLNNDRNEDQLFSYHELLEKQREIGFTSTARGVR